MTGVQTCALPIYEKFLSDFFGINKEKWNNFLEERLSTKFSKILFKYEFIKNAPKIINEVSKSEKVGNAIFKPVAKVVKPVVKTVDKIVTAPARAVDAGWKAAHITPVVGQGLLHSNWWNRGERAYEAGMEGARQGLNAIDPGTPQQPPGPYAIPQQKYGGQFYLDQVTSQKLILLYQTHKAGLVIDYRVMHKQLQIKHRLLLLLIQMVKQKVMKRSKLNCVPMVC